MVNRNKNRHSLACDGTCAEDDSIAVIAEHEVDELALVHSGELSLGVARSLVVARAQLGVESAQEDERRTV